jgi:integrase
MLVDSIDRLGEPEKKRLLELACGLDKIMLLLLFETGLEVEDLIDLRVSDLDMMTRSLQTPSGRRVQLSPRAQSEIERYLNARPGQVYLLEGRCGKPVTGKWRRCVLEKLCKE